MGVFFLILSIILFIAIILACKWGNFSIIPKDLSLKSPKKFKFPKIKRGEDYKWTARYSSDEESESDDDILFVSSSESDSDEETVFF